MPTNSIHITNSKGRDATVGVIPVNAAPSPKLGLPTGKAIFRKYIAAAEACTDAALTSALGSDYAMHLVEGNPEIDAERVGMAVGQTQVVFLDGGGDLMYADPAFVEVIYNPDGTEKERREPVDSVANVNAELPVRWTGKRIPIADAVRRFSFRRTMQLRHGDGLTFDYLYEIARDLEEDGSMMLLGSGAKGAGPLLLQSNGRQYRGFLRGETKGKSYRLSLHLSDMELKRPVARAGKEAE